MNLTELKELLSEMAELDLADGADIYNHPCSVAIRAIDGIVSDVQLLRGVVKGTVNQRSKRATVLVDANYSPEF